jgi:2-polyprenyl-3-methyl-5-hydroxy-6-metoxy-1,4-benzoquinol methylase
MTATCPACGGVSRPTRLLVQAAYRLFACPACGTQFLLPERAEADGDAGGYWEPYKFDVYGRPEVQQAFDARYDRMLADARAHVGPIGSVLDVGCGIGNFLAFATARGIRAVGTDVEAQAVATARERGHEAFGPGEIDAAVPDGSIDAVTMWDVVEHLSDPAAVLGPMAAKVRPGGALLFETPDAAFPVRTVLRGLYAASRGRVDLTPPMYYWEHKVYFTAAGLAALLARVGAEPVVVRRETSVREKMSAQFGHDAEGGDILHRVLARTWPVLESAARRAGRGNKLMVVARVRG